MKSSETAIPKKAAALFGAAFAFVFLQMHGGENIPDGMLTLSKWLVLFPAAFLFTLRPSFRFAWTRGLALTGGVFAGVCLLAIIHASNIWPIAGVYWTAIWLPSIAIGSVAGFLVAWATGDARR